MSCIEGLRNSGASFVDSKQYDKTVENENLRLLPAPAGRDVNSDQLLLRRNYEHNVNTTPCNMKRLAELGSFPPTLLNLTMLIMTLTFLMLLQRLFSLEKI